MKRRQALLLLALVCSSWSPARCADDAPAREPAKDENRKSGPDEPNQKQDESKAPDEFNPSEDISADFPVDFPTDI